MKVRLSPCTYPSHILITQGILPFEARGTFPDPYSSSTSRLRRPKSTAKFNPSSPYATPSTTSSGPTSSPFPPQTSRPLPTPEPHQVPAALQAVTPRLLSEVTSQPSTRTGAASVSAMRQPRPILKSALRGPQPVQQAGGGGGGRSPQTSESMSEVPNSESDGRIPSSKAGRVSTIGRRSPNVRSSIALTLDP